MAVSVLDGPRIQSDLDDLGLTQRKLAERHHLHVPTLSRALHGHAVGAAIVYDIARAIELEQMAKKKTATGRAPTAVRRASASGHPPRG